MGLQMAWRLCDYERRRPPLGLKNLGNSCYLNSVLQCLTYTPPLAQFCLSSEHSSLCKRLLSNKEKECPFCILERQIARSLKLEGNLDAPSKLQKCLNLFAENFRWGRQEDAHEFLRYVIDSCHNTCLKLLKHRSTFCNGSAINGKGSKPNGALLKEEGWETRSIMNQIFGGSLLSQVKCLSCKAESNKTDDIMDISLDLFESNSLRDALSRFFRAEVLDGSNKYSCERCKKLSAAKKQMFIIRAPNVLVIQLKRFEGVHGGKINRNIEFEEMLELSNYVYKSAQELEPRYNLFGSIVHAGYSPESGHYYAYIKDAYGRWYCCNDAHVSLSSTQEVLSEKVYILFYLRCNQHQKTTKIGSPCKGVKSTAFSQNDTSTFENSAETSTFENSAETSKPLALINNGLLRPNNNVLPVPKNEKISIANSAETSKPLALINNGLLRSNNNVLPVPKNEKISSSPQFKPINLKKCGTPRFIKKVDEKLEVHANGRCDDAKKSPSIEKAMLQSKICMESSKCTDNLDYSSMDSNCSTILNNNGFQASSNGTRRSRSPLNNSHENNATSNLPIGRKDPSSQHSSGGQSVLIISSKRKFHDNERADYLVSSTENSSVLPTDSMNHSSEEHDKFKELLASETRASLRSCDWYSKVHDFMRSGKKSRTHAAGPCPNKTELKEEIINGARENFNSQIPGSLIERLIELLKSFSQSHSLLDI